MAERAHFKPPVRLHGASLANSNIPPASSKIDLDLEQSDLLGPCIPLASAFTTLCHVRFFDMSAIELLLTSLGSQTNRRVTAEGQGQHKSVVQDRQMATVSSEFWIVELPYRWT